MSYLELEKEKERIQEKRIKTLNLENDVWMKNCKDCTLVPQAVNRGELPNGTTKDRQNHVCKKCPAHHQLLSFGRTLEKLLKEEKVIRKTARSDS